MLSGVVGIHEKRPKRCRKIKSRTRVLLMKMRRLPGSCRHQRSRSGVSLPGNMNGIGQKVRTLKQLIRNGKSKEIDSLFLEAADYILALQMKVKAMQIMVHVLSAGSNDDHHDIDQ